MTVVRVGVYVGVGVLPGARVWRCPMRWPSGRRHLRGHRLPLRRRPPPTSSAVTASTAVTSAAVAAPLVVEAVGNDLEDDAPPSSIASGDSARQGIEPRSRRVMHEIE